MDDRTYHELVCACCDSPCSVSVNDAGAWEWETPCPVHGKIVRMSDAVIATLKVEHEALRMMPTLGVRFTKTMRDNEVVSDALAAAR